MRLQTAAETVDGLITPHSKKGPPQVLRVGPTGYLFVKMSLLTCLPVSVTFPPTSTINTEPCPRLTLAPPIILTAEKSRITLLFFSLYFFILPPSSLFPSSFILPVIMTKQSIVVPEEMLFLIPPPAAKTVFAAAPQPGSFPPPRSAAFTANYKKLMTHLDLHGNSSWAETMKTSSPTHLRTSTSHSEHDDTDWNRNHPSALCRFEEIAAAAKGKKIVMFLDYDGTLSPIVDNPDSAFMSEAMRAAVKNVARYFPTAIVSGRCRDKVFSFVQLAELYYAGSHGMDIKGPTKWPKKHRPSRIYSVLLDKTKLIPGVMVENNIFCLSVHFRCVEEKRWIVLEEKVRSVLASYPELKLTQGRKVLEIRPTIEWDKGKALEFLLAELGLADRNDILPNGFESPDLEEAALKKRCSAEVTTFQFSLAKPLLPAAEDLTLL
ncbi:putative trehalose-phosphate phosphatase 4 [Platanthera guangdongensis]|uniref:Trehalose 6-phosphate phosphatase n=1 Tax=Platanthera guangdongensis TaxID=2320717 RepID=A0ABR2MT50_9ASPA